MSVETKSKACSLCGSTKARLDREGQCRAGAACYRRRAPARKAQRLDRAAGAGARMASADKQARVQLAEFIGALPGYQNTAFNVGTLAFRRPLADGREVRFSVKMTRKTQKLYAAAKEEARK